MWQVMRRLWREECGAVLTTELVLAASVAVLGVAAGLEGLRDVVNEKCGGLGQAIRGIDQGATTVGAGTREWASKVPFTEQEFSQFLPVESAGETE